MVWPYTLSAKLSQYPYKYVWREAWNARFLVYSIAFMIPILLKVDKTLTGPENKAYWREKRKHDREHHLEELKKKWEVRT